MPSFLALLGEVFLLLVLCFFFVLLFASCIVFLHRECFPRFSLFLLSLFHRPLKMLLGYFRMNPALVDEIGVSLMNSVYWDAYCNTPLSKRMLFLPQCLRSLSCPAHVSPLKGVECEECGSCVISELKKLCDEHRIKICIAPGGEFVKRAVERERPEAAVGVACPHDLYETMRAVSARGIPMVGVLLLRSGCVSTDVDAELLKAVLLTSHSHAKQSKQQQKRQQ